MIMLVQKAFSGCLSESVFAEKFTQLVRPLRVIYLIISSCFIIQLGVTITMMMCHRRHLKVTARIFQVIKFLRSSSFLVNHAYVFLHAITLRYYNCLVVYAQNNH